MISEATFQSSLTFIQFMIIRNGFGVPSCPASRANWNLPNTLLVLCTTSPSNRSMTSSDHARCWSLSNAFASAFKELHPIPPFKATAKPGEFLEALFTIILTCGVVPAGPRQPNPSTPRYLQLRSQVLIGMPRILGWQVLRRATELADYNLRKA